MTALWPRYINIRRGQVICAFIGGWALCPWEILARCVRLRRKIATVVSHSLLYSATGFLAFMGGYTVFLGPIAGIMVTDVSGLSLSPLSQGAPKLVAAALSTSIGSYTAHTSTFPQCISLMEGTGIHMAL